MFGLMSQPYVYNSVLIASTFGLKSTKLIYSEYELISVFSLRKCLYWQSALTDKVFDHESGKGD